MAIPKVSLFIPLGQGALDTKKAPLSMPVTSLLQCDNVVQERRGEFRRRNGFTQVATDTLVQAIAPSQVANMGQSGMFAATMSAGAQYEADPNFTGVRWTGAQSELIAFGPDSISRTPLVASTGATPLISALCAFSSDGNYHVASGVYAGVHNAYYINDITGSIAFFGSQSSAALLQTSAACVPNIAQCIFSADNAGNLRVDTRLSTTGVITSAFTVIKAGLNVATPFLQAGYYTGSTITVVAKMAAGGMQFMEWNPVTAVFSTDVNIAGTFANCISLIMEPSNSGIRIVGSSDAVDTRIRRINSAGAVQSTDILTGLAAQIIGCGNTAGAEFVVIFQTTGGQLVRATKIAGVVAQGNLLPFANSCTLAGQGWAEPGDTRWFFLMQGAKTAIADYQVTTTLMSNSFASGDARPAVVSPIVPLQALPVTGNASVYQAVRTGTRTFYFTVPVTSSLSIVAGVVNASYVMTAFEHDLIQGSDTPVENVGRPCLRNGGVLLPGHSLTNLDQSNDAFSLRITPVGTAAPLQQLSLTQAAGGALTLLGTYLYSSVLEVQAFGLTWRGPPSVPVSITLTGANATVNWTQSFWGMESHIQKWQWKLYRSAANGSTPTLVAILAQTSLGFISAVPLTAADTASDVSIALGEILYTVGEQPNMCWPGVSHVWVFDDRVWAVNRDFPTEIQYSKNLQAQRQPETTAANVVDIDDQWGPVTNGSSVEGRGVIFKQHAIYFVQGDGLTDAGTGNNYTFTRISDDVGSMPGTPLVNAGDAIYFVSQRGIYSVDAQGTIKYVGGGIDAFFNQPQVNTPESVYDGIFVPSRNEVRFVTTNYIFVYDRNFPDAVQLGGVGGLGQWSRWTIPFAGRRCLLVNDLMVVFDTLGRVWKEGTTAQTTDQGTAFAGIVRTGWIRYQATGATPPAPTQAPLRFYGGRAVLTRTAGGGSITATAKVYFNDDDSQVQAFTSQAIAGATLTDVGEFFPTQQKCTSFSMEIDLPSGDDTLRIEGFAANIGIRAPSEQRRPAGEKWS